jgi:GWxTD domain-containing protein
MFQTVFLRFLCKIFAFSVVVVLTATVAFGQQRRQQPIQSVGGSKPFYFDVLGFFDVSDSSYRVDMLMITPYQTLQFLKEQQVYLSQFAVTVILRDSTNKKITSERWERSLAEEDYKVTIGGTAEFDFLQHSFNVTPGRYTVEIVLEDKLARSTASAKRSVEIAPLAQYPFSLSSVMLASAIAKNGDRYSVTPYLNNDILELGEDGFFVFFEAYQVGRKKRDSVDFLYEVLRKESQEVIRKGKTVRRAVAEGKSQQYVKIDSLFLLEPGDYILRLIAIPAEPLAALTEQQYLAVAERPIEIGSQKSMYTLTEEDLDVAIRQLVYVASSKERTAIIDAQTIAERRKLFIDFWRNIDPSPGTVRNEAFDDYYQRIAYANEVLRGTGGQGWRTDMGAVLVIFGRPLNVVPRQTRMGRAEEWIYGNSRRFIFVDNGGFGDFRLTAPLRANDKYRYGE